MSSSAAEPPAADMAASHVRSGSKDSSLDSTASVASEDGETDLRQYLIQSGRSTQRRATDFSQADNDLRRFLAQREAQRRDSDQDMPAVPTREVIFIIDGVLNRSLFSFFVPYFAEQEMIYFSKVGKE